MTDPTLDAIIRDQIRLRKYAAMDRVRELEHQQRDLNTQMASAQAHLAKMTAAHTYLEENV